MGPCLLVKERRSELRAETDENSSKLRRLYKFPKTETNSAKLMGNQGFEKAFDPILL